MAWQVAEWAAEWHVNVTSQEQDQICKRQRMLHPSSFLLLALTTEEKNLPDLDLVTAKLCSSCVWCLHTSGLTSCYTFPLFRKLPPNCPAQPAHKWRKQGFHVKLTNFLQQADRADDDEENYHILPYMYCQSHLQSPDESSESWIYQDFVRGGRWS